MRIQKILLVGAAVALMATACAGEDDAADRPHDLPARPVPEMGSGSVAPMPPRAAAFQGPPEVSLARVCGSVDVVDKLAAAARSPEHGSGSPGAGTTGGTLMELGSTLRTLNRDGLPKPMAIAIGAHSSALITLGELINRGASREDVNSMGTVTAGTSSTVKAFCES